MHRRFFFFPDIEVASSYVASKTKSRGSDYQKNFLGSSQSSHRSVRYFCQTQLMPIIQKILFLTQFFTFKCSDTRLIDQAILHFFAPVCFFLLLNADEKKWNMRSILVIESRCHTHATAITQKIDEIQCLNILLFTLKCPLLRREPKILPAS